MELVRGFREAFLRLVGAVPCGRNWSDHVGTATCRDYVDLVVWGGRPLYGGGYMTKGQERSTEFWFEFDNFFNPGFPFVTQEVSDASFAIFATGHDPWTS